MHFFSFVSTLFPSTCNVFSLEIASLKFVGWLIRWLAWLLCGLISRSCGLYFWAVFTAFFQHVSASFFLLIYFIFICVYVCVFSCFPLLLWLVAQILYSPTFSCLVGTQVWSKLLPGIINSQEICEKIMQK